MKCRVCILSVILLLLCFAGSAWSRLLVSPYVTASEEYTDNLFLTNDNEDDDWITTVQPGIRLLYNANALNVDADYSLRFQYHYDNTDEDETALRDIQRALVHALAFPGRDFTIAADGEVSKVTIDERGPEGAEGDPDNTTTLYDYSVNPKYRWAPTRNFAATLGYRYTRSDYASKEGDDTYGHEYSLLLTNRLSGSTDIHLRYSFLDKRADYTLDYEQQNLTVGFVHRFGARLTLSAEGGPVRIDYDDGTDANGTSWDGSINYQFSEILLLKLAYLDAFSDSTTRGQVERESASASLLYEAKATLEGRLFWVESDYLEEDTTDREYGTALDLRVPLAGNYYVSGFAEYKTLKYLPENESADRYALGTAIGYEAKKLEYSLGYRYRVNDSNVDENDYQNNRVTLTVSLRY